MLKIKRIMEEKYGEKQSRQTVIYCLSFKNSHTTRSHVYLREWYILYIFFYIKEYMLP